MAVVDRKTLAWIKDGVEETLKNVHHVPDEYVQNTDNPMLIAPCIEALHRVRGGVEIIGIQGATLLAIEMESLACAMAADEVTRKKESAEVLATGMLQLPGYLESLYHGQPDIPLILLPILNDLRAVQDKELLTEGEFFAPDLSRQVPVQLEQECIVSGDLRAVAKKLRPGYLAGLLGVIKNNDTNKNLEQIYLVLDNLMIASATNQAKQLWWITLGIIEALYEQALETSIAVKILLGRVDRQIQRVVEHGEEILVNDPPHKISKNLLYYIAQAHTYSDRIIELKKAFNLDYPDDKVVNKARENLYSFNANLIDTVTSQVKEELVRIKDALDIAMHAKGGSTEGLDEVLKHFSVVGDALAMLGMHSQRELISAQREFLTRKIAAHQKINDEEFMGVASAVLRVESSLADFGKIIDADAARGNLPPAEYDALMKAVAGEIITNIKHVKHATEEFSTNITNNGVLVNVPAQLLEITGVMRVMYHDIQANLTQAVHDYITGELIDSRTQIHLFSLDLLADAIVGLENFYQTILEESVAGELGLEVGCRSIARLGYPPQDCPFDLSEDQFQTVDEMATGQSA